MVVEFLILIGVFMVTLDQVRRLRSLNAQQKADFETYKTNCEAHAADLAARLAAATDPAVQAELDAFEAELTPPNPGGAAVGEGLPTVAEVAANDPAN